MKERAAAYLKDPNKKTGGIDSNMGSMDIPDPPLGSNIDPKLFRLGQFGFAKGPVTINAIIRVIISLALLPIAQIFVSFFFLYTTSGLGLILNEGFSPLFKVMAHMNDNDGEDEKKGDAIPFYDSINKTDFFRIWVNELFISSILSIFWIVKAITVPLLVSKLKVKIIASIILGILSIRSILLCGIVYRRRMCTIGEGLCTKPVTQEIDITTTANPAFEVKPSTNPSTNLSVEPSANPPVKPSANPPVKPSANSLTNQLNQYNTKILTQPRINNPLTLIKKIF
jgi:hypothetical protein